MQSILFSEPDTKPKVPPNQLSGGLFKAIQRPRQPMGQVYAENGCCRNHKRKGRPDGLGEDQKLIGGYCPFCEREWGDEFNGRKDERDEKDQAENQECGEEHEQTQPDRIRSLDLMYVEPRSPLRLPLVR